MFENAERRPDVPLDVFCDTAFQLTLRTPQEHEYTHGLTQLAIKQLPVPRISEVRVGAGERFRERLFLRLQLFPGPRCRITDEPVPTPLRAWRLWWPDWSAML